ncbi:MAG: hypothetical protein K6F63_02020 [Lachnospiraceae bacterium]|nr:hypothetical protein [Lachnospiraceae bacterium]
MERTDVEVYYIPATKTANDMNISTLANMIITGKLIKEIPGFEMDSVDKVLGKIISARHQDMLEFNKKALETGYNM